jgi:hypothetical protein
VDHAVQLAVLAASYVLALGFTLSAGLLSLSSYRSSKRLEARKDIASRLTRVETELASYRDVTDAFSKRLTKRDADTRRQQAAKRSVDPEAEPLDQPLSPDDLVRAYRQSAGRPAS